MHCFLCIAFWTNILLLHCTALDVSHIKHKGLRELVILQQREWKELNDEEEEYLGELEAVRIDLNLFITYRK